ncbi:hypothetical protein H8356DRAFT_1080318 [Neocallimastix lanati (nom. inval.)]|nr:hypothetical protein H8356DRAFT_1080318 [Neocallimastix sp. JGI-2020a]
MYKSLDEIKYSVELLKFSYNSTIILILSSILTLVYRFYIEECKFINSLICIDENFNYCKFSGIYYDNENPSDIANEDIKTTHITQSLLNMLQHFRILSRKQIMSMLDGFTEGSALVLRHEYYCLEFSSTLSLGMLLQFLTPL